MNEQGFHIRRVRDTDLAYILDWENNVEGWNTNDSRTPYSPVDIMLFISEQADIYKARQVRWMICLKEDPIGAVDLTDIDFNKSKASVGILIADKKNREQGFAKRALLLLEEEAFSLGINKLTSSIHPTNEVSIALFKKLNYIERGKGIEPFVLNGKNLAPIEFEKCLKK